MKNRQPSKKKPKKKYTGHGFIQTKYPASKELYTYFWSLTEGLRFKGTPEGKNEKRKNYHRFLAHLYVSMRLQGILKEDEYDPEKYIPIYSRLIDKKFGKNFFPSRLVRRNIIEIKPHSTTQKKSRHYRLVQHIFEKGLDIDYKSRTRQRKKLVNKGKARSKINLMTGRETKTRVKSQLNNYKSGVRDVNTPPEIKESIKSFKACPFNEKYVRIWVAKLKKKSEREKEKYEKIKNRQGEESPACIAAKKAFIKAEKRYLNDSTCLNTILNQNPKLLSKKSEKGDPLYKYKAAYTPQNSGRISERFGGFQSASKYFKHLFFRDMSDMFFNYDLKNSQANVLLQELEKCNKFRKKEAKFKTAWLKSYLADPDEKERLAKKIGIPVELWKDCFYAVIMGAVAKYKGGAVYKAIREHFSGNTQKVESAYYSFLKETEELIDVTEKWRDYLYKTKNPKYHYQHGKIKYWKNACKMHYRDFGIIKGKKGKKVLINRLEGDKKVRSNKECKRKLAAFILQGRESFFIHNLTILCRDNKISVFKNENDGLITGKKIPNELVSEAAEIAGLRDPVLEIKELCPKKKRQEMRKYVKS